MLQFPMPISPKQISSKISLPFSSNFATERYYVPSGPPVPSNRKTFSDKQ